jgi:hypothetical protein
MQRILGSRFTVDHVHCREVSEALNCDDLDATVQAGMV